MNFLNEVCLDFPGAVSFAPGRPPERWFRVEEHLAGVGAYVIRAAETAERTPDMTWAELGQYNRTNGIISSAIVEHLARDYGIHASPDAIMVTTGAQEAMAILVAGLFDATSDILLVTDPSYIGITGFARVIGVRTVAVPARDDGVESSDVERAIVEARKVGRVRAVYDIPNFNNPLGTYLSLDRRLSLLEVCRRHDVLLIEDDPYGLFAYDGPAAPPIKALDSDGTVVYIGSFSKTLFPAVRVGYMVADQLVGDSQQTLAKALSTVKSVTTVNTSSICQAIVASALHAADWSVRGMVEPAREHLRRIRDVLVDALSAEFAGTSVTWNRPSGGFFMWMSLPFDFGAPELHRMAKNYGVIVCPMQFFSNDARRSAQIRLSFSAVDEKQIRTGVAALARFVRDECVARGIAT